MLQENSQWCEFKGRQEVTSVLCLSGSGAEAGGDGGECVSVCVVPSELRAYGVWNAAGGGLTELRDSSSSLLFLTLSDAQARLLHTELSTLHKHSAGER